MQGLHPASTHMRYFTNANNPFNFKGITKSSKTKHVGKCSQDHSLNVRLEEKKRLVSTN